MNSRKYTYVIYDSCRGYITEKKNRGQPVAFTDLFGCLIAKTLLGANVSLSYFFLSCAFMFTEGGYSLVFFSHKPCY